MDLKLIHHLIGVAWTPDIGIELMDGLIFQSLTYEFKSHINENNKTIRIDDYSNILRSILYRNKSCPDNLKRCIEAIAFITGNEINIYFINQYSIPVPMNIEINYG